ncbi:hypothetical protein [Ferrovibrio sp.]|uniref:hypothetical protein n=1 Tax=Ferrovibrio sp. TaxID=1917215 RepID=UPI003D09FC00
MTLREWLDKNDITVPAFARQIGRSRMQVWRIVNGGGCSQSTQARIIGATDGGVTADDLLPPGLKPVPPHGLNGQLQVPAGAQSPAGHFLEAVNG